MVTPRPYGVRARRHRMHETSLIGSNDDGSTKLASIRRDSKCWQSLTTHAMTSNTMTRARRKERLPSLRSLSYLPAASPASRSGRPGDVTGTRPILRREEAGICASPEGLLIQPRKLPLWTPVPRPLASLTSWGVLGPQQRGATAPLSPGTRLATSRDRGRIRDWRTY